MDDVIDPALAAKIECFLSRKNEKYGIRTEARPRWNGYEYIPREKWFGKRSAKVHHKGALWAS